MGAVAAELRLGVGKTEVHEHGDGENTIAQGKARGDGGSMEELPGLLRLRGV